MLQQRSFRNRRSTRSICLVSGRRGRGGKGTLTMERNKWPEAAASSDALGE